DLAQGLVGRATGDDLGAGLGKDLLDQIDGGRIVVHDHDARAGQRGAGHRPVTARDRLLAKVREHQWQPHHKRRALPFAGAFRVHAAAVQLDEMPDQRQTDPQAALSARTPALALAQAIEDERQGLGADASAGIADDDLDVRPDPLQLDLDPSIFRGELDRVLQQVPDDLLKTPGVAAHQEARHFENWLNPDALRLGRVTDRLQRVLDEAVQIDRLQGEPHLAADDLGDVEQIVEEPDLRLDVAGDDLDRPARLRLAELAALDEGRPAVHGVERIAQLVRDRREE